MKYVSLYEIMRLYGNRVNDMHNWFKMRYDVTTQQINSRDDFTPFQIEEGAITNANEYLKNSPDGQTLNIINVNEEVIRDAITFTFIMPPILEIEWLKTVLNISDEHMKVLNQMGYLMIIWIITWNNKDTATERLQYMANKGIIKDVEDLADVPQILSNDPLPNMALPKIYGYDNILLYGTTFPSLYRKCRAQSTSFKELYYHMPILLTLFMRDYEADKLSDWSKGLRLTIENEIKEQLQNWTFVRPMNHSIYGYGLTSGFSTLDVTFLVTMLTFINEKLHKMNTEIGLITYNEYIDVKGPEIIKADVRLCALGINWYDEIERANKEKEQEEDQNEDTKEQDNQDEGGTVSWS